MKNKNLIIGGLVLVALAGAYYFYNKNKGGAAASNAPASASSPSQNEPISKIQKNACGQTIPTVIPCVKNLDNDGKCYDSKGVIVDINKIPMGQPCFNKNGTSRDVRNIAI